MSNESIPAGQREFRCDHCHGKILIPIDLPPTTGPCPHCGQPITSPVPEFPGSPAIPAGGHPSASAGERIPDVVVSSPVPLPEPVSPIPASNVAGAPPQPEVPAPASPESEEPKPAQGKAGKPSSGGSRKGLLVGAVVVMVLVLAGLGVALFLLKTPATPGLKIPKPPPGMVGRMDEHYLEKGWETDARGVLSEFLQARTPEQLAQLSIRGEELLPEMQAFYKNRPVWDGTTPEEAFAVYPLEIKDRQRGIFMLMYDQPPAFRISDFFIPLVPLGVQYQVEAPSLLTEMTGQAANFASDPVKVMAPFKKGPDGLKVDWEAFVQTKYRLFREFLELPESGKTGVFRLQFWETVPENRELPAGERVYQAVDPAYSSEDSGRLQIPVDSEIGRVLSVLNWRGTDEGRPVIKSATVELRWSDDEIPQLEMSRFICWEFLGVGGEALPGGGVTNGGK